MPWLIVQLVSVHAYAPPPLGLYRTLLYPCLVWSSM
jgi:hypothetical protein